MAFRSASFLKFRHHKVWMASRHTQQTFPSFKSFFLLLWFRGRHVYISACVCTHTTYIHSPAPQGSSLWPFVHLRNASPLNSLVLWFILQNEPQRAHIEDPGLEGRMVLVQHLGCCSPHYFSYLLVEKQNNYLKGEQEKQVFNMDSTLTFLGYSHFILSPALPRFSLMLCPSQTSRRVAFEVIYATSFMEWEALSSTGQVTMRLLLAKGQQDWLSNE